MGKLLRRKRGATVRSAITLKVRMSRVPIVKSDVHTGVVTARNTMRVQTRVFQISHFAQWGRPCPPTPLRGMVLGVPLGVPLLDAATNNYYVLLRHYYLLLLGGGVCV